MGEGTDELINGRSNRYSFMYMVRSLPGLVGRVKSKVFTPKGLIKRHIKERGVLHLKNKSSMRRNALKIKYWPQIVTIVVWVYICGSGMN